MYYLNPGKIIRELFPRQTRTVLRTVIWSIVFVLDIALVIWVCSLIGFSLQDMSRRPIGFVVTMYVILAVILFTLQTIISNKIEDSLF